MRRAGHPTEALGDSRPERPAWALGNETTRWAVGQAIPADPTLARFAGTLDLVVFDVPENKERHVESVPNLFDKFGRRVPVTIKKQTTELVELPQPGRRRSRATL